MKKEKSFSPKTSEIKTKAVSKGPKLDNLGREVKEEGAGEEISREEMDAYRRSSLSKLAAAARNYWFRRGSMAGDPIDRMRGGAMDSDTFGHNLKISFHLNLHPVELQHLIQIFDVDGDGKVDGAEFVSLFLRLVDEERKKQVRAKAAAIAHLVSDRYYRRILSALIRPLPPRLRRLRRRRHPRPTTAATAAPQQQHDHHHRDHHHHHQ